MKKKEVWGLSILIFAVLLLAATLSFEITTKSQYGFLMNFLTAALIMIGIAMLEVWFVVRN
ncbi:hypothetical protein HN592_00510 [Candidatus Woesearchaeota archaeon]|jgi:hypothetical protein|nr:hypothetical protein [Candidatus Woesearchaeota archaeon]MBT4368788.1 hypothetical protein [Candidatus Woesearchaeota archaeon]MBT4712077.1 hypothetical protein [Candidatus Woesearchaeota archaeon]MBT6639175.1 hypothetical protein [Candidatus Woesearchaeota archaeon]MBT7134375.1 hypothetical protein [Candidatus Woesearchaeota archaeon]